MPGIYIHIPFCLKKCGYCDFSSLGFGEWDRISVKNYIDAVKKEISSFAYSHDRNAHTIFFGGGTPSILKPEEIEEIINAISEVFNIVNNCEISLEANPGTLDEDRLNGFKNAGINRLNLGIQSLNDGNLATLGRIHNRDQGLSAISDAVDAGFSNIGIDVIYGIPGQTLKEWENELMEAVSLPISHISLYCLTPEEGTPLGNRILRGEGEQPNDEILAEMMAMNHSILEKNGFIHYEISNFAKPGFFCRHNIKYWKMKEYIGFGSSANSYMAGWRWKNESNPYAYIDRIYNGIPMTYGEKLSKKRAMGEFMMLGLRMNEGIKTGEFEKLFDGDFFHEYGDIAEELINKKQLILENIGENGKRIYIPPEFFPIHNEILQEFIEI